MKRKNPYTETPESAKVRALYAMAHMAAQHYQSFQNISQLANNSANAMQQYHAAAVAMGMEDKFYTVFHNNTGVFFDDAVNEALLAIDGPREL